MSDSVQFVPVADLRNGINYLERVYNVDRHACCGEQEKYLNAKNIERARTRLQGMDSKRKSQDDKKRLERIMAVTGEYLDFTLDFNECFEALISDLCVVFDDDTQARAIAILAFAMGKNITAEKYTKLLNQQLANLKNFI